MDTVGTILLVIIGVSFAWLFIKSSILGFMYIWICGWDGYWDTCFNVSSSDILDRVLTILGIPGAVLGFLASIITFHFISW